MLIKRKSWATGNINAMDIDVTEKQLEQYDSGAMRIDYVMPELSLVERRFLVQGYLQSDWDSVFGHNLGYNSQSKLIKW